MQDAAVEAAFSQFKRFLRETLSTNEANNEERVPNIDIAIADAAKKVNKKVVWKIKFAVWRYLIQRTPLKAREKMGMGGMGRKVFSNKNFEQLMAYNKFYGKGPQSPSSPHLPHHVCCVDPYPPPPRLLLSFGPQ
ncbi:unnamed protein product [Phytophthora lilii]|uniref:Unnamed protein product n=1 Tax=Phytophthora lilii TaxID=2077276 RepID=A0A9W6U398_9STRA|nr:unnamed protein product [Phytophthora lilii]